MTADRAGSTEVRTIRVVGFGLRMAWLLVELVLVWRLGIIQGTPVGSAD